MGMLAKVEGEVSYMSNKVQMIEFYSDEVLLPDGITEIYEARSMLKNGLMAEVLRKKVKNFKRVRTCSVLSLIPSNDTPKDSEYMLLLRDATKYGCVPEGLDHYGSVESRKKALEKAIVRHKARLDKRKVKSGGAEDELSEYVD